MSIFSWGFARAGVVLYSYEDGSYKGMFVCKNPLIFTHYFNICALFMGCQGFPDSSAGKESACSGGDPSSIPGSERSAEEGIGYPFQYSWASLVIQMIKNLPVMQGNPVHFLDWEDPLEKG